MTRDDTILVSVLDHVIEPPTVFENHVPTKWAGRAPRRALRWFDFDPFRFVPKGEATVGALRARAGDVDIRTRSKAGRRAAFEALHGPIG